MSNSALPALAAPAPPMRRGVREGVLSALRSARQATAAWEVEAARLVVDWANGHRLPARIVSADGALLDRVIELEETPVRSSLPGMQAPMRLAGPGAPIVWDLAFCELASTLSMSLDGARGYVGEVVELGFRLPRLWERVRRGEVRLWRAREVASATMCLPADGAAWVDTQLAAVIGSCSGAQLRRVIEAALDRFDPHAAETRRRVAAEGRHFDIRCRGAADGAGTTGVVTVDGALDLPDALDLEAAVAARAEQLAACGSEESIDVRRALAVGEIARNELTLPIQVPDAHSGSGPEMDAVRPGPSPTPDPAARSSRPVRLILHLSSEAIGAGAVSRVVGRCENTRSPLSAEQIRTWCGAPGVRVTVQPVIDVAGHQPVDSYEIPTATRTQVTTREPQCVFPSCTRRADKADLDHIVPWEEGGPTCACNLAPLCRRHHRAKTHGGWSYVMVTPGTYLWYSPSGVTWLVDGVGTYAVPTVGQVCSHEPGTRLREPPEWDEPPDDPTDHHEQLVDDREWGPPPF